MSEATPELIFTPGIYRISNEEYHKDPVAVPSLSRGTIADLINETPAHTFLNHPRLSLKNEEEHEEENEPKFDIGTAAHSLLLEGLDIAVMIDPRDYPGTKGAIPKGWTTDAMRTARSEARAAGKIPLLPKQYKQVVEMVNAAHRQLAESELKIKSLHTQGAAEQTYIWEEDGTWFRVRPDWISHKNLAGDRKLILDYKTTGISANPLRFKASDNGKDIQHALYRRGVKAVEGGKEPKFLFFVQETFPPYLGCLVGLDPQTVEIAKQKVDYGKFMWEQCHALGEWPGYPLRVCYVEAKPWEAAAWEEKASSIGTEDL